MNDTLLNFDILSVGYAKKGRLADQPVKMLTLTGLQKKIHTYQGKQFSEVKKQISDIESRSRARSSYDNKLLKLVCINALTQAQIVESPVC